MKRLLKQKTIFSTLGIALCLSTLVTWAYGGITLKGIELRSSGKETRIILKSDSPIPYHVVTQSPEKIVLDLSTVNPNQSFPTDFASAENIQQVVIKPIDNDKVRMVIRGDNMAPVMINSTSLNYVYPNTQNKVVYERESLASAPQPSQDSKVKTPQDGGFAMTAYNGSKPSEAAANTNSPVQNQSNTDNAFGVNTTPVNGETANTAPSQVQEPGAQPLFQNEDTDLDAGNLPKPTVSKDRAPIGQGVQNEDSITNNDSDTSLQDTFQEVLGNVFKGMQHLGFGLIVKISLFLGMVIFLGILIRRKLGQDPEDIGQSNNIFSGLFKKSNPARRTRRTNRKTMFTANLPVRQQPSDRRVQSERPVGLSGFQSPAQNPISPKVPHRQAINQYVQNSPPPIKNPPSRESTEIDHELKRSLDIRQGVYNTHNSQALKKAVQPSKPIAKKSALPASQPNKNLPKAKFPAPRKEPGLPDNNTEVLDFLRSVAELMEKDGKTELAKGVHKGIASKTQR